MHSDFCRLLRRLLRAHPFENAGELPASIYLQLNLPDGTQLRTEMMDLTLKDDTPHTFAVVLKDKLGAVATANGPVTVASSDETVVTATLSTDGSQLTVAPAGAGKLGAATVTVSDAADSLSAVVNVTVVAGTPASLELDEVEQGTVPAPSVDASAATQATETTPANAPDSTGA